MQKKTCFVCGTVYTAFQDPAPCPACAVQPPPADAAEGMPVRWSVYGVVGRLAAEQTCGGDSQLAGVTGGQYDPLSGHSPLASCSPYNDPNAPSRLQGRAWPIARSRSWWS